MRTYIIANPPYDIGGKIMMKVREELPDADITILMPISCYRPRKFYEYIDTLECIGGDDFEDAVITKNNCIITLRKDRNNSKSYLDYVLQCVDQKYMPFYKWNLEHPRTIGTLTRMGPYGEYWANVDKNLDFVESLRSTSKYSNSGFSPNGASYKFNYLGIRGNTVFVFYIHFNTRKARDNFRDYWYEGGLKGFNSRVLKGLNKDGSVSDSTYYMLPNIDWESVSENPLWYKGNYANCVLDIMGLKQNKDKDGVEYK